MTRKSCLRNARDRDASKAMTPRSSPKAPASTMPDEEYEVETVLRAKIFKRGSYRGWKFLIKWKGYGDADNTWEPADSFEGSADEVLSTFWERVNTGGRDISDSSNFKHGEEFFPLGPPARKSKKSRATDTAPRGSSSDKAPVGVATPDVATASTKSKAKRPRPSDLTDSVPKKRGRTAGGAKPNNDASKNQDEPQVDASEKREQGSHHSHSLVPDSEDEIMLVGSPQASPSTKRHAKPLAAPATRDTLPLRDVKPGPGRSSKGLNHKSSSLLTGTKQGLATVPRTRTVPVKVEIPAHEDRHEPDDGAPVNDPTNKGSEPTAPQDTPAMPPPTLLELAGLDDCDLGAFSDYDEEPVPEAASAATHTEKLAEQTPESTSQSSAAKPFKVMSSIFGAVWGGSTIFGPFGLASSSARSAAMPASTEKPSEPSSIPYLVSLDPARAVPVTLKDISAPSSLGSTLLDTILKPGPKGPPGKLYRHSAASSVLNTLNTGGFSARMVPHESATEDQRSLFANLQAQLDDDGLFIFVVGPETLACCASTNKALCEKLRIAPAIQGLSGTVMVSHVQLADHCAFADAAMQAEPIRW
ncbi:hypothetical protein EVG20_g353 [Dentipellis fragilis]|uniref:Chromo domain-containing protein n=1 Tax=Dentipellis fragilis TaxID=205917 RepID=A0A4Y9ZD43_9AGAM|nr:hypothetical protein EVG20_g353 [Dentipellis fragilis]